jgi:transcription antitermination factor NusA-like protein
MTMLIPQSAASKLIGAGGKNIKAIRENTGLRVNIDKQAYPQGAPHAEQKVSSISASPPA